MDDLLNQDYPAEDYEVIFIDDASEDRTAEIVNAEKDSRIRLLPLHLPAGSIAFKKAAITLGVSNSSAELIITTDGDCRIPSTWLREVASFYLETGATFISGPVSFYNESTWQEKLQTVEFQYLIGVGAACIQNGIAGTCNGANLIYTKALFLEMGGFDNIDQKASGDDELLLHKVFAKYPEKVAFLKSKEAVVVTQAHKNFKSFFQQRKRWASKSPTSHQKRFSFILAIVFLCNLFLLAFTVAGIFNPQFLLALGLLWSIKIVSDGLFMGITLKFFDRLKLWPLIPIVIILYVPYILIIGTIGKSGQAYVWKGRLVK
jgi:cellulose synthase/poly-beta-1,6-N-acetylglucosamine synthase-like glycosyltransferase